MKKKFLAMVGIVALFVFVSTNTLSATTHAEEGTGAATTHAEEKSESKTTQAGEESESAAHTEGSTSISIMPVNKILQISSNSVYEDKLTVNNDGDSVMKIEVYASPYSYVYSENEDAYKLGFNSENNFTQMSRWITFKTTSDEWVKKAVYTIEPKNHVDVNYRISTPESIPAGGQYAVIFAHTLTSSVNASGIRTEASPGMVVYGRSSEGETIIKPVISDLSVRYGIENSESKQNGFYASAKVKNEGNVDFNAIGKMVVKNIFGGGVVYETAQPSGMISVIPDAELTVSDSWTDPPFFGLYQVSWSVSVGEESETVEKLVFVNFPLFLILSIILLTIIIIGVIIGVRRRKERRSRLVI